MSLTISCIEKLQTTPHTTVGNNISERQADTEVLAMLLRDLPVSSSQFEAQSGEKPFVSMSILVVAVGNAGFSAVPYVANNKGAKPTNTKKLYEDMAEGRVLCYPYQKGKTNKDKGIRVETYIDATTNEKIDAPTILQSGMYITNFLREESFGSQSKFFVNMNDQDVLPAGSLVYVQVSGSNIEQAQKGHFFKFRKCMLASHVDSKVNNMVSQIPASIHEFDNVISDAKNKITIANQVYGANSKVFSVLPSSDSYAVHENGRFVIVRPCADLEDVEVDESLIAKACGSLDLTTNHKLLSIALAMNAVSCIISHNSGNRQGNLVLNADCAAKALWIHIDFRQMLRLSLVHDSGMRSQVLDKFVCTVNDDYIVWTDSSFFQKSDTCKSFVFFRLARQELDAMPDDDTNHTYTESMLTYNAAGPYYPLEVFLVGEYNGTWSSESMTEFTMQIASDSFTESTLVTKFLEVQFNTQNLKEADGNHFEWGAKKRKRPVFELV